MTIAEIESIVRELRTRHENLDEEMLITLLTAGGWENKAINDALVIFRGSQQKNNIATSVVPILVVPKIESMQKTISNSPIEVVASSHNNVEPTVFTLPQNTGNVVGLAQENKSTNTSKISDKASDIIYYKDTGEEEGILKIIPEAEQKRDISKERQALPQTPVEIKIGMEETVDPILKNEIQKEVSPQATLIPKEALVAPVSHFQKSDEPQSRIEETAQITSRVVLPPENLPLKPFESTPHIWPFSKYKEVFHGETMPALPSDERILVTRQINKEQPSKKEQFDEKSTTKKADFDKEDDGLIFLTGVSLFIILLLLAYMYSNGRL